MNHDLIVIPPVPSDRGSNREVSEQQLLDQAVVDLLAAEASKEDMASILEQLKANGTAWLSHRKLMTDPVLSANIKEFSFFPTPAAHAAFFDLINTNGAAENIILYRSDVVKPEKRVHEKATCVTHST